MDETHGNVFFYWIRTAYGSLFRLGERSRIICWNMFVSVSCLRWRDLWTGQGKIQALRGERESMGG